MDVEKVRQDRRKQIECCKVNGNHFRNTKKKEGNTKTTKGVR